MLLDVPEVYQQNDFTCGSAAIEMLLRYDGIPAYRWLRKLANPVTGLEPEALCAALNASYGGRVISGTMTVPLLKHLTHHGRPVICLATFEAGGHWVVIRGVQRNRIHFSCPSVGRKSLSVATWEKAWVVAANTPSALHGYGVTSLPLTAG